jgi:hypothetical protein
MWFARSCRPLPDARARFTKPTMYPFDLHANTCHSLGQFNQMKSTHADWGRPPNTSRPNGRDSGRCACMPQAANGACLARGRCI